MVSFLGLYIVLLVCYLLFVNLMKIFFYEKLSDDKINIIGYYGFLIKVIKENRIIIEYIV